MSKEEDIRPWMNLQPADLLYRLQCLVDSGHQLGFLTVKHLLKDAWSAQTLRARVRELESLNYYGKQLDELRQYREDAAELLREIRDGEVNPEDEADKFLRDDTWSTLSRTRQVLTLTRDALVANHEWHKEYGEEGYEGSWLEAKNLDAIKKYEELFNKEKPC